MNCAGVIVSKRSQEPSHPFLFLKAQPGVEPSSRDQVGFRLVLEAISRIKSLHFVALLRQELSVESDILE